MKSTEFDEIPALRPSHVLLNLILDEEAEREGWKSKFRSDVRRAFGIAEDVIPFPPVRLGAFREVQREQQDRFRQAANSGEQIIPVYRIEAPFFYSSEPQEILWVGSAGWGGAAESGEGYLASLNLGDELKIDETDDLLLFHRKGEDYLLQKMINEGPDRLTGRGRSAQLSIPLESAVFDLEIGEEGLLAPCLFVQAQTSH